jgi:DNA-dependent RNA polymerase
MALSNGCLYPPTFQWAFILSRILFMTLDALVQQQLSNEVQAKHDGTDKIIVRTNNALLSGRATDSVLAKLLSWQSVKDAGQLVEAGIDVDNTINDACFAALIGDTVLNKMLKGGNGGKLPISAKALLAGCKRKKVTDKEPPTLAYTLAHIAQQVILNGVLDCGTESQAFDVDGNAYPKASEWNEMSVAIGIEVEQHARLQALQEFDNKLFNKVVLGYLKDKPFGKEYAEIGSEALIRGLDAKAVIKQWAADKKNFVMPEPVEGAFEWESWSRETQGRVGMYLLGTVMNTKDCPFGMQLVRIDNKTYYFVVLTEASEKQQERILNRAMHNSFVKEPMLVQPLEWGNGMFGGYLSNKITHRHNMIRANHTHVADIGELPINMLNNLQQVGYLVNDHVFNAAMQVLGAMQKGTHRIGSFEAKVEKLNRAQIRKTVRTMMALAAAEKFSGREFYLPWSFDYRGRVYPLSAVLQPQGTDFDKSLLLFADAQPVTDRAKFWLAVHVANCFGNKLDKKSFDDRLKWVAEHKNFIVSVAEKPAANLLEWGTIQAMKASERDADALLPDDCWQFVAACKEYVDCVLNGKQTTNLPIATDASCSGIQVLSGMTHDKVAASLVNVTPGDVPADAYAKVAETAAKIMRGEIATKEERCLGQAQWSHLLDRKVAKKVVMTLCYNASVSTNNADVKAALRESGKELPQGDEFKEVVKAITWSLVEGCKIEMPKALHFRDWLTQSAVGHVIQYKQMIWATPSEFVVVQFKNRPKVITINTQVGGKRKEMTLAVDYYEEACPGMHKTCSAPNLVHSWDASLLHIAFEKFDKPFTLIHDSILTTAADMDAAIDAYKIAYVKCFGDGVYFNELLAQFEGCAEVGAPQIYQEPVATPELGELLVHEVVDSQYMMA